MATWDLTAIRKKVRNLTGLQETSSMTNETLDGYINRYYLYSLPLEVKPRDLQAYYEFDMTADDDEYDLDATFYDSYTSLASLAWVSKGNTGSSETEYYRISVYMDPSSFFSAFPASVEYTESRPQAVLIWQNKLLFRAIPDDDYRFRIVAWTRPTELSTALSVPCQPEWGSVISTGAALEIAEDLADNDAMQRIQAMHQQYLNNMNSIGSAWLGDRKAAQRF